MKQTKMKTKPKLSQCFPNISLENRKTRPKYRQFMLKNNQSDLEATMICLLSKFAAIEFTKPQKDVKVTKEFLKIKNLKFKKEKLNVKDWKKRRFSEIKECMKKEQNMSDRLITHRMEQINRSESMHLIEDILFLHEVNVFIEQEETNGIKNQTEICDEARASVVDIISNLSAISEENAASSEETTASMAELSSTIGALANSAEQLKRISEVLEEEMKFFQL